MPEATEPIADEAVSTRHKDLRWAFALTLLAALPRLAGVPIGSLNVHAARDVFRSLNLLALRDIPLAGSELYFGGAVPGNFYFYLGAVPLIFWKSPFAIAVWIALLTALAGGITYIALRKIMGQAAAVASCIAYACFPLAFVEGLWVWNPSYLPFFSAIALWGFCHWIRERRGSGLAVMLTAGLLAIQVHLSSYTVLVTGILVALALSLWRLMRRTTEGARGVGLVHYLIPLAAMLPFVLPFLWINGYLLFLPLRLKMAGDPLVGLGTFQVNSHALATLAKGFVFMDDSGAAQEFVNFQRFYAELKLLSPGLYTAAHPVAQALSVAGHASFALIGVLVLLLGAFGRGSSTLRRGALEATGLRADCARPAALGILLWLLVPALVLLKTIGNEPGRPLGIPTRYIVIYYPTAMILTGLGFAWVWGAARRGGRTRVIAAALFGAAQAAHLLVIGLFIWVSVATCGVFKANTPENYTKPLFVEKALTDFLAGKHGAKVEDFRERFFSDSNFMDFHAEQVLNFVLFQGEGADRPGADKRHWFYLYDTRRSPVPPRLIRESGPVVDELRVGQFRLLVIRRDDPSLPIAWPQEILESPMIN